jgi:hypothetical protein
MENFQVNLTETKWKIHSLECTSGYGIFKVNIEGLGDKLYIGYKYSNNKFVKEKNSIVASNGTKCDLNYILNFKDGDDISNNNLINWVKDNATLCKSSSNGVEQF